MAKEKRKDFDPVITSGRIVAHISDFEHGLRNYESVRLIRIKSKDYSLLIMEDYFPVVGVVEGTVDIVTDQDQIPLGTVKGYYLHRNNEFSLIIEDTVLEEKKDTQEDGETDGRD